MRRRLIPALLIPAIALGVALLAEDAGVPVPVSVHEERSEQSLDAFYAAIMTRTGPPPASTSLHWGSVRLPGGLAPGSVSCPDLLSVVLAPPAGADDVKATKPKRRIQV